MSNNLLVCCLFKIFFFQNFLEKPCSWVKWERISVSEKNTFKRSVKNYRMNYSLKTLFTFLRLCQVDLSFLFLSLCIFLSFLLLSLCVFLSFLFLFLYVFLTFLFLSLCVFLSFLFLLLWVFSFFSLSISLRFSFFVSFFRPFFLSLTIIIFTKSKKQLSNNLIKCLLTWNRSLFFLC